MVAGTLLSRGWLVFHGTLNDTGVSDVLLHFRGMGVWSFLATLAEVERI